jgi:hypothetical protein
MRVYYEIVFEIIGGAATENILSFTCTILGIAKKK